MNENQEEYVCRSEPIFGSQPSPARIASNKRKGMPKDKHSTEAITEKPNKISRDNMHQETKQTECNYAVPPW